VPATTTPTASVAATTAAPSATNTHTATSAPTPSQTASPSLGIASTPTLTPTLGAPSVARRVAGVIPGTTNALLVIPNLLSAVLGHSLSSIGNAEAVTIPPVPFTCPDGGGGTVSCNQSITPQPPFFGPPTYGVTINNCVVSASGRMLTFNGGLTAQGQQGDVCGSIPNNVTLTIPMLTVTATGASGTTTTTFNQVTGAVDLSCSGSDCQCSYDTVTLHLSGSMAVTSKDSMDHVRTMTQATFTNDDIGIMVEQYGSQCVPIIYSMQLDGAVGLTTDGNSFQATFSNYVLHDNATSATDIVDVSGQVSSGCLGGAVVLSTQTLMSIAAGDACPSGGEIQVAAGERVDLVRYTAPGGVEIDFFADDSVDESFVSCLDPRLAQCPAG